MMSPSFTPRIGGQTVYPRYCKQCHVAPKVRESGYRDIFFCECMTCGICCMGYTPNDAIRLWNSTQLEECP